MVNNLRHYLLDLVVFVTGAIVMILELTGSRILAPYIGTSLPVWTSIIGVVLGSLSLGYFIGGKLADSKPSFSMLSLILLSSTGLIAVIPFLNSVLMTPIINNSTDIRSAAVISALVLFTLPSITLGMVSPYAIRLKLENISSSGRTAGTLYALSTIGSIVGTFMTGFYLLGAFKTTTIIFLIAGIIFVLSILVSLKQRGEKYRLVVFLGAFLTLIHLQSTLFKNPPEVKAYETPYNSVRILDYQTLQGEKIREMLVGNVHMSAMFLESDELVYDYTKYYRLVDHFTPDVKNALMIGGAGYSYPKDFVQKHPDATLDVVEIDPELTRLAQEYFDLKPSSNLRIYHEDARTFLNKNKIKYDAIFNDAFGSYAIPFQLTTKEAVQKMSDSLAEDGVIITNIVSAVEGDQGKFLRAEYKTYKSIFPYVYIFPVSQPESLISTQNIMLIALKREPDFKTDNPEFKEYLSHRITRKITEDMSILTDEYAPVEIYEMSFYE